MGKYISDGHNTVTICSAESSGKMRKTEIDFLHSLINKDHIPPS